MKKLILLLSITYFLTGCSKDQRTVNKLDGEWNIKTLTINGQPVSGLTGSWEFEKCKQKKGECDGKITEIYGGATDIYTFEYEVSDKGKEIEITLNSNGQLSVIKADMDLDKDDLDLDFTLNGTKFTYQFKRD